MQCPNCGNTLANGQTLCDICGTDVSGYIRQPARSGLAVRRSDDSIDLFGDASPSPQQKGIAPVRQGIYSNPQASQIQNVSAQAQVSLPQVDDMGITQSRRYIAPKPQQPECRQIPETPERERSPVTFIFGLMGLIALCGTIFFGGIFLFTKIFM